jgi:recombinational DNA repair protein (RecF pathway)
MDVLRQNDASQIPALTRYCEIWMLRLSGFLPDCHRCSSCKASVAVGESVWFVSDGAIQCTDCSRKRGYEIRPAARAIIVDILKLGPKAFVAVTRESRALKQVAYLASRLIQQTLERELKSIEIISRLEAVGNSFGGT